MGGQIYRQGGNLLCHDDDLEGRRIAFILYLVEPDWCEGKDGGQLDLFEHDRNGNKQPTVVSNSVVPCWNTLAFFEVTRTSYHQVREILGKDSKRVSITGWFHADKLPAYVLNENVMPPSLPFERISAFEVTEKEDQEILQRWINPEYLKEDAMQSIRDVIVEESTVSLNECLLPSVYEALMKEFRDVVEWKVVGPPNLCRYEQPIGTKQEEKDGSLLSLFKAFLGSLAFKRFLARLSNLDLCMKVPCYYNCYCLSRGSYSLMRDDCPEPLGLDVIFSFEPTTTDSSWKDDFGGQIHYVVDEETLLTLQPMASCSLVVRDEGTLRFVKYVNSKAPENGRIFSISCIYPLLEE